MPTSILSQDQDGQELLMRFFHSPGRKKEQRNTHSFPDRYTVSSPFPSISLSIPSPAQICFPGCSFPIIRYRFFSSSTFNIMLFFLSLYIILLRYDNLKMIATVPWRNLRQDPGRLIIRNITEANSRARSRTTESRLLVSSRINSGEPVTSPISR